MRLGEPDKTRQQEGHVPLHSLLGCVASPVSIKARSLHALDQLLNSTNHMPCIWGTVNRRNMQYFTDLKAPYAILDAPLWKGMELMVRPKRSRLTTGC